MILSGSWSPASKDGIDFGKEADAANPGGAWSDGTLRLYKETMVNWQVSVWLRPSSVEESDTRLTKHAESFCSSSCFHSSYATLIPSPLSFDTNTGYRSWIIYFSV